MGINRIKLNNNLYPHTELNINTLQYYEGTNKNQANSLVKDNFAIADSGTTDRFLEINSPCKQHFKNTNDDITAVLPDGTIINSSHTAMLDINHLPEEARRCYLFKELKHPLLSISQLCDSGYMALFDDAGVYIIEDVKVTLHGLRNKDTGLHMINLSDQSTPLDLILTHKENIRAAMFQTANNVYGLSSKKERILYYHQYMLSPTISTWISAIDKGFFVTCPELTSTAVKKYLTKTEATAKGYTNQQFQNIRSTKSTPHIEAAQKQVTPTSATEKHYYTIEESRRTFFDQTCHSRKYKKYMMMWCHYDINSIITEPMKNRTEGKINRAFQKIHEKLAN